MMRTILFPVLLSSMVSSLSVTPTNNANDLAKAVLGTTGLTLKSATYSGASTASGLFTNGPQSIRDAAVLTTGRATDTISKAGEIETVDGVANGGSGSPTLCGQLANGAPSYDAAILTMEVELATGYDGFEAQFVFTTEEYPEYVGSEFNDAFGVYVDGKQVAFDDTGAPITVNGPFFSSGTVITPPQSGSSYNGSTPLLRSGAPASPGTHKIEIAICDVSDRIYDSGVFIAINACQGSSCETGTDIVTSAKPSYGTSIPTGTGTKGPYPIPTDCITLTSTATHTKTTCTGANNDVCNTATSTEITSYTITPVVSTPYQTKTVTACAGGGDAGCSTSYQTIALPAVTTYPGYSPGSQQPTSSQNVGAVPTYYQGVAPKKGGVDAAVVAAAGVALGAVMML